MKFLVLALCVCAASAATFPRGGFGNFAKASASVTIQPPAPVVQEVSVFPAVKATKTAAYVAKSYVDDGKDVNAQVLRSDSEVNAESFAYNYETSNGIVAEAQGAVKELEKGVKTLVIQGQYRYESPEGPVVVTYEADENGFRPKGDVIPTAPPVPAAILRALEYIAAHPHKEEVVKKF